METEYNQIYRTTIWSGENLFAGLYSCSAWIIHCERLSCAQKKMNGCRSNHRHCHTILHFVIAFRANDGKYGDCVLVFNGIFVCNILNGMDLITSIIKLQPIPLDNINDDNLLLALSCGSFKCIHPSPHYIKENSVEFLIALEIQTYLLCVWMCDFPSSPWK